MSADPHGDVSNEILENIKHEARAEVLQMLQRFMTRKRAEGAWGPGIISVTAMVLFEAGVQLGQNLAETEPKPRLVTEQLHQITSSYALLLGEAARR